MYNLWHFVSSQFKVAVQLITPKLIVQLSFCDVINVRYVNNFLWMCEGTLIGVNHV